MYDQDEEKKKVYYGLAVNKDFANVYAVPQLIKNPKDTAEKLFAILDKEEQEEKVEEMLQDDEFFKEMESDVISVERYKELEEFRNIKKELEIETRKKLIIDKFISSLSKRNDPYEPIRKKVDNETLEKITALEIDGINFFRENYRYYPEIEIGSHILGFVGYSGVTRKGNYGLEGFFDEELSGKSGSIKTERSAGGELIIINDRQFEKPVDGSDIYLTINRSIQFEACKELEEAVLKHEADGGSVIVMNPMTGAIMAMCSSPKYDPNNYNDVEDGNVYNNPAIFDSYEPGSIFKVITMAAGLNEGVVSPDTLFNDKGYVMVEGWKKPIKNSDYATHGAHGMVDMVTVLEKSLNTGMIDVVKKVGYKKFAEYVKNFGFGEKTGIELETEGLSNIKNLLRNTIRPVEAATASFGQGITVTPLQMISSYSAIANGGILMKPFLVEKIVDTNGKEQLTQARQIRRVMTEKSALLLSGMMVNVVDGGHAKLAGVGGYYVAGKTGTAQVADKERGGYLEDKTIHTFVGFAPVEEPKFVMLVKLDDPKDVKYSASSAAPLFGRLADFILNYYQIAKTR